MRFKQGYTHQTLWLCWVLRKCFPLDVVKMVVGKRKLWIYDKVLGNIPALGDYHVDNVVASKCVISYRFSFTDNNFVVTNPRSAHVRMLIIKNSCWPAVIWRNRRRN
jgi:hypothetical protein